MTQINDSAAQRAQSLPLLREGFCELLNQVASRIGVHNNRALITKTVQQSFGTCLSRILAFLAEPLLNSTFPALLGNKICPQKREWLVGSHAFIQGEARKACFHV